MNKKYIFGGLFLLVLASFFLYWHFGLGVIFKKENVEVSHNWTLYQSKKFGFSFEYPADILNVYDKYGLPIQFIGVNNGVEQHNVDARFIEIDTWATTATSVPQFFNELPGIRKTTDIGVKTVVDGIEAFDRMYETGYLISHSLDFLYRGQLWGVVVDNFTRADADRIIKSFKLMDVK